MRSNEKWWPHSLLSFRAVAGRRGERAKNHEFGDARVEIGTRVEKSSRPLATLR